MLLTNFQGRHYRLANNWFSHVDVNSFNNKAVNYLEIGAFYGANIISVGNTYCSHKDSKMYCIDPWIDYDDYDEYKNEQPIIYDKFLTNIRNSGFEEKIIVNRGFSHEKILDYKDAFFDIIYIDGNHNPESVLEDAVMAFRKLKVGGIMIFDDYGWGGPDLTQRGIDSFLSGYHKRISMLGEKNTQIFVKKVR